MVSDSIVQYNYLITFQQQLIFHLYFTLQTQKDLMKKTQLMQSNFTTLLKEKHKKRKLMTQRNHSQRDLHISLYNLWKAKTSQEQKLITAVRSSQVFSPERVQTFVKFNYRTIQNKNINYQTTFKKVLQNRKSSKDGQIFRGTMQVSDLWSQGNMQELIGNLPYPKDRLKILKEYQKKKQIRIKTLPK